MTFSDLAELLCPEYNWVEALRSRELDDSEAAVSASSPGRYAVKLGDDLIAEVFPEDLSTLRYFKGVPRQRHGAKDITSMLNDVADLVSVAVIRARCEERWPRIKAMSEQICR